MRFALVLAVGSLISIAGCGGGNDAQQPPQTPQQPPPYGYNPNAGYPPPNNGYPPPNTGYPPPSGSPAPQPTFGSPTGAPPAGGTTPPPAGGGAGGTASPFPFPMPSGFPNLGAPPPAGGSGGGGASGGSAQALDPNVAGVATAALNLVAGSETAGMQREGATIAGNFQQGQTLESGITIQPGRCYTFVAAGTAQQIDITLVPVSPVPGLPTVGNMGSAKGTGQKTVLGGGGNCIKLAIVPVPVQAKWIVTATAGQGLIAAQAFVK